MNHAGMLCVWLGSRQSEHAACCPPAPPRCAGKAASVGVTTAAQVTVQVGTEAIKAAVPVGKWALQQGFKLAVGAVRQGMAASNKKDDGKKKK